MIDHRLVTVVHKKTKVARDYWVNADGTSIWTARGGHGPLIRIKPRLSGSGTPRLNFNWKSQGAQYMVNVCALIWAAWKNDGVYLDGSDGLMTIDHIDNNHKNNHYKNLQRISRRANSVKALNMVLEPTARVLTEDMLRQLLNGDLDAA